MKIYTLKATKSRSNPQVIREFQIDGSCAGCVNRDLIQNIFGIVEVKE